MRKELLIKLVGGKCEDCGSSKKLEIHKINRDLGYHHRNCKVLCKRCHDYYSSAQRKAWGIQK